MTTTIKDEKRHKGLGYIFEQILAYYGFTAEDFNRYDDDYLRMACPIHNGDNKSAFIWRYQYHSWTCYSHSCQELVDGNSAFHFILAMEDGDKQRADEIAQKLLGDNNDVISNQRMQRRRFARHITHDNQPAIKNMHLSYFNYSTYPTTRGIPRHLQRKYKIGIYRDLYPNKVGFPIFDQRHRIVGITLRKLHDEDVGPKWIHKPDGYKASVNLYNIHKAITHNGTIILTEGPIDVLKLVTCGFNNCVATFGCSISKEQIRLLKSIGAYKIVIAYDNDKAGNKGCVKVAKMLNEYGIETFRLLLEEYNDFGEMPLQSIRRKIWTIKKL